MNAGTTLALVLALALPAAGQSLTFRNDARTTVVVQTATLQHGRLRSDRPIVLRQGAFSTPVDLGGDKMITVYDGRSNRILFQGVQRRTEGAMKFSIQPDPRSPGKVLLVPGGR